MSIDNCSACLHSIDHNGALIPHNESEVCELQVVESAQAIPERHHSVDAQITRRTMPNFGH